MIENKDIEELLKNVQIALRKYSIKELNEAIIIALQNKHDKTNEVDFILKITSNHFNINVKTLINSKSKGNIQEAKKITYCLLHFNLGLSIRYIATKIFNTWPNTVAIGINKLKNINIKIKQEAEFLNIYEKLRNELIQHLTKNN